MSIYSEGIGSSVSTSICLRYVSQPMYAKHIVTPPKDIRSEGSHAVNRDLKRRFLTHVVQKTNEMPASLTLNDVEMDSEAVDGGSFAKVYHGWLTTSEGGQMSNNPVAVKAIEVYPRTADNNQIMQVRSQTQLFKR